MKHHNPIASSFDSMEQAGGQGRERSRDEEKEGDAGGGSGGRGSIHGQVADAGPPTTRQQSRHHGVVDDGPVSIDRSRLVVDFAAIKDTSAGAGADYEEIVTTTSSTYTGFANVWDRFQMEADSSYDMFSKEEPDGRQIDVTACFAPRPFSRVFLLRTIYLLVSLQVLYHDVSHYPPHNLWIYMGYLTHWGHVLVISYFFASWLCSGYAFLKKHLPSRRQPAIQLDEKDPTASFSSSSSAVTAVQQLPRPCVRAAWALYSVTAPLQVAICLLYWTGIHDSAAPIEYVTVMEHGVLGALVWIDGLVVGRVPVRVKHLVVLGGVCLLYLVWSVVDVVAGIGGGDWGPADTDDGLYPVLRWGTETGAAAVLSAFCLTILIPCLFTACWLASLWSPPPPSTATTVPRSHCCGCRCVFDGSRRPLLTAAGKDAISTRTATKEGTSVPSEIDDQAYVYMPALDERRK